MTVDPVMRRQSLFVVLSASAALAAVALVVMLRPGTPQATARPVTGWQAEMVACANGQMNEDVLASRGVQSCLESVMVAAIDAGQLDELQAALEAQIRQTPALYARCHNIGHLAGQHAFKVQPDIEVLLATQTSTTCQYALGHGILDGFADSAPSDADFARAAEVCVALNKQQSPAFSFCADGLGHAAWASTKDLTRAVPRCALFSIDHLRALCAEGIIMQIYEPAGFLPSRDIAAAPEELPVMCASWPDGGDPQLRKGCHSGAGYIYTRPAWRLAGMFSSYGLSEDLRQKLVGSLDEAIGLCRSHGQVPGTDPEAVSSCLHSISQQVPPAALGDELAREAVCSQLDEWADRCRDWQFLID